MSRSGANPGLRRLSDVSSAGVDQPFDALLLFASLLQCLCSEFESVTLCSGTFLPCSSCVHADQHSGVSTLLPGLRS